MKLYSLKCPHCGGNLEIEEDLDSFFCKYCGAKIIMDRLSKSEMRVREMEHDEIMSEHQMRVEIEEAKKARSSNRSDMVAWIVIFLTMLMMFIFAYLVKH